MRTEKALDAAIGQDSDGRVTDLGDRQDRPRPISPDLARPRPISRASPPDLTRLGAGLQSLFGFARTMIQLNIVLGLLFFCLVNLPQLVHNTNSRDFYFDYVATISSQPINYTDAPSLLYIGGYEPVYYNEDGYSDTRRAPPQPPHYRRPGRAREQPRLARPRL